MTSPSWLEELLKEVLERSPGLVEALLTSVRGRAPDTSVA